MGKFNMNNIYSDRIKQIELDEKKAISKKNWTDLAKLKAEKARLEETLKGVQV